MIFGSRILTTLVIFGCSACMTKEQPQVMEKVYIDSRDRNRVWFEIYGHPWKERSPEIFAMDIPFSEKARIGFREYAKNALEREGLCPFGFSGPRLITTYENNRMLSIFHVECTVSASK